MILFSFLRSSPLVYTAWSHLKGLLEERATFWKMLSLLLMSSGHGFGSPEAESYARWWPSLISQEKYLPQKIRKYQLSCLVVNLQRQSSLRNQSSSIKTLAWKFPSLTENPLVLCVSPSPSTNDLGLFLNKFWIARDEYGEQISSCPKVMIAVDNV